jgi:hypothetical protein
MVHTFGITAGSLIYWSITVANMTAEDFSIGALAGQVTISTDASGMAMFALSSTLGWVAKAHRAIPSQPPSLACVGGRLRLEPSPAAAMCGIVTSSLGSHRFWSGWKSAVPRHHHGHPNGFPAAAAQ